MFLEVEKNGRETHIKQTTHESIYIYTLICYFAPLFQEAFETSPWRRLLKRGWKGPTKWANQRSPASSTVEPPWAGCHKGAHQMLGWLLPSWHGFRNNNYYIYILYMISLRRDCWTNNPRVSTKKKQNAIRTFWCEVLIYFICTTSR